LGNLALELWRLQGMQSIFIKITDKEMIGFGQGAQIGKSSSGALEAPRYEINTFIKRIEMLDKELRSENLAIQP